MQNLTALLKSTKTKSLMAIFPHPDDESFATGGLLLAAKRLGYKTVVAILTKGDAGKNFTPANGKTLAQTRTHELGRAVKRLGVTKFYLGDFPDAKLRDTKIKWSQWVKDIVKKEKPSMVVTYDPSGFTGHPDHIVLSLEIKETVKSLTNTKLFWVSFPINFARYLNTKTIRYFSTPTHIVKHNGISKLLAILEHKSQGTLKKKKSFLMLLCLLFVVRTEWYHEVDLTKEYRYKYVKFDI